MKKYQITYLISINLLQEQANDLHSNLSSFIKEKGATFGMESFIRNPERIKLAKPIKKDIEVYIADLTFSIGPEKLIEIEKEIKNRKEILRYLIVYKKPIKPDKKPRRRKIETLEPKKVTSHKKVKVELKDIEKKIEEILKEE